MKFSTTLLATVFMATSALALPLSFADTLKRGDLESRAYLVHPPKTIPGVNQLAYAGIKRNDLEARLLGGGHSDYRLAESVKWGLKRDDLEARLLSTGGYKHGTPGVIQDIQWKRDDLESRMLYTGDQHPRLTGSVSWGIKRDDLEARLLGGGHSDYRLAESVKWGLKRDNLESRMLYTGNQRPSLTGSVSWGIKRDDLEARKFDNNRLNEMAFHVGDVMPQ